MRPKSRRECAFREAGSNFEAVFSRNANSWRTFAGFGAKNAIEWIGRPVTKKDRANVFDTIQSLALTRIGRLVYAYKTPAGYTA